VPGYAALWALIANLAVAGVGTVVARIMRATPGRDATAPADYGE
jgi:hypothetical protein